jgi:tRNA (cytidine32/uridine32-2'-O)-methyltransferase
MSADFLDPGIRIVLVETQHPGNLGSAARAMKTMGLRDLVLVAPHKPQHPDAVAMAAGADDVLAQARIFDTLAEALADCAMPWPGCWPKPATDRWHWCSDPSAPA